MQTCRIFAQTVTYVWDRACKNRPCEHKKFHFSSLLYHNLITIYTTGTKCSSLLQNLMGFLFQLRKWKTTFQTKDISKNITWCNLCSHGRFSQAQSHMYIHTFNFSSSSSTFFFLSSSSDLCFSTSSSSDFSLSSNCVTLVDNSLICSCSLGTLSASSFAYTTNFKLLITFN